MKSKKGFIHTIEMVIAVLLTFIFVIYIIPQFSPTQIRQENVYVLQDLKTNQEFIHCVNVEDASCVRLHIREELPQRFSFDMLITDNPLEGITGLPPQQIFVDSIYLSGNITDQSTSIVKLYYWLK